VKRNVAGRFVGALAVSAVLAGAAPGAAEEPQPAPSPASSPSPRPSPAGSPGVSASLPITFGASVTLRSDTIDMADQSNDRDHAMRARIRLGAEYREPDAPVNGGLRLSAGETPNPAGSFPRLGNALRPEAFGLDQFYVSVRPFEDREAFAATVGKVPLPFWRGDRGTYRSQMIWDHDISPVGAVLKNIFYKRREKEREYRLENTLAFFVLEDLPDAGGGLAGKTSLVADQVRFQAPHVGLAFAYYGYDNLNVGLRSPGEDALRSPGTSAFLLRPGFQLTNNRINYGPGADGFVRDEFRIWNALGEVDFALPFVRGRGRPQVFLLADYAHNTSVPDDGDGYYLTAGLYGGGWSGTGVHPWGAHFAWADVDADAALATFANSDLGGGTNYRGWEVSANYRYTRNLLFVATYFDYRGHPNKGNVVKRLYLDVLWDF
jgi:putative porin